VAVLGPGGEDTGSCYVAVLEPGARIRGLCFAHPGVWAVAATKISSHTPAGGWAGGCEISCLPHN